MTKMQRRLPIFLTASILLCLALTTDPSPPPQEGWLSAYAKRPTLGTLAYRLEHGQVTAEQVARAEVLIAVDNCGLIGREGTLTVADSSWSALVYDCGGADGGHSWMQQNAIVAEVDYFWWMANPHLIGAAWAVVDIE